MLQQKPWFAISIVLLICVVCLAAGISWFLRSGPPALTNPRARAINFANFLRIEQGMSESPVGSAMRTICSDSRPLFKN